MWAGPTASRITEPAGSRGPGSASKIPAQMPGKQAPAWPHILTSLGPSDGLKPELPGLLGLPGGGGRGMHLPHFAVPRTGRVILQKESRSRGAGGRVHQTAWSRQGPPHHVPLLPTPRPQHIPPSCARQLSPPEMGLPCLPVLWLMRHSSLQAICSAEKIRQ